mmetsp:Transcript_10233/g.24141  ORF Transcript_10233/g.24141 Transcript_10233/m.24141 type:complete len:593 (+) Transcript_10233:135-1913(+)
METPKKTPTAGAGAPGQEYGYTPSKRNFANTLLLEAGTNDDGKPRKLEDYVEYEFKPNGPGCGFGCVVTLTLGKGGQAKGRGVILGKENEQYTTAVKFVPLENKDNVVDLAREWAFHNSLKGHESDFIVKMTNFFVISKTEKDIIEEVAMTFKYYPDGDLRQYAEFNYPLGNADIKFVARSIAQALKIIHAKGYAHRDLKPENCMVVKTPDGKLAAVLITDTGLIRLVHDDPFCDEHTAKVGTKGHQCRGNAIGGYYDPIMNDIFSLGALVYCIAFNERLSTGEGNVIYVSPGKSTKRKDDAAANRMIRKLRKKLQDRLGLDKTNELLNTLYTNERDCPTLEKILACEFLAEGLVSNDVAGLSSIDEDGVANDFGAMGLSDTGVSEAVRDFCRMLMVGNLTNEAMLNHLVSWTDFIANAAEMLAPLTFQIMLVKTWNKCLTKATHSFSGVSDFLDHFEEVSTGLVYDFLRSPAATDENAHPYDRESLGDRPNTIRATARTAALNMADAFKAAYVARTNELNGVGETFELDDMVGIIGRQFSEAPGFKKVVDRERRMLGKRLYAIHLHDEENWGEDGDDGNDNGDDGNGGDNE